MNDLNPSRIARLTPKLLEAVVAVVVVAGCASRRLAPVAVPPSAPPTTPTTQAVSEPAVLTSEPAAKGLERRWAGTYIGTLESSGREVPVTTRLDQSGRGLIGSYVFEEPSAGSQLGTLSDCNASTSTPMLSCSWRDRYGSGILEFYPSMTGNSWSGRWRAADDTQWFKWNGTRQDDAPEGCEEVAVPVEEGKGVLQPVKSENANRRRQKGK